MKEISTEKELEEALLLSKNEALVLFKHSTRCPVSSWAYKQFMNFDSQITNSKNIVVLVIESRKLSTMIAQTLNIKHESPQAFIIKDGVVKWHASHNELSAENIRKAFEANT